MVRNEDQRHLNRDPKKELVMMTVIILFGALLEFVFFCPEGLILASFKTTMILIVRSEGIVFLF